MTSESALPNVGGAALTTRPGARRSLSPTRRDVGLAAGLFMVLLVSACASTGLVLRRPIEKQCKTVKLKQCDDLVNGILLYVDGDEDGARSALADAVRANQPEKLRKFAEGLQTISHIPGASSYMEPIAKVSEFLAPPAPAPKSKAMRKTQVASRTGSEDVEPQETEGAPGVASCPPETQKSIAPKTAPVPEPAATWNDPTKIDGGTVTPSLQAGAETCNMGIGLPMYENDPFNSKAAGATSGVCLGVVSGPITVTDIHASGGCTVDLFVIGGTPSHSRWLVQSPARTPLHITGARLAAREGEVISVGVAGSGRKTDARCALTWAGWKPYGAVSPTAKGFPTPSHSGQPLSATLGDPMQPGTQGRSSRMAAGAGTSVADKETSPTEARPTQQQRAVREKKPIEPDDDHPLNLPPRKEAWEDPFTRSVTQ
jgi:hypothetical protein